MLNDEKIKNFTSIIQSITVTVAVIVGGIWSLYTFKTLGQQQKAKYDLIGKPSLNIEIETITTKPIKADSYIGLIINVNIENKGTRYINLKTLDSVLCITSVGAITNSVMGSFENMYLEPVMRYRGGKALSYLGFLGMQPNSKKTLPYYCELTRPGIYFISFFSQNSKEMNEELSSLSNAIDTGKLKETAKGLGATETNSNSPWFAEKYVEIK